MATVNQIDDWILEFAIEFNSIVHHYMPGTCFPIIRPGTSPIVDIRGVIEQGTTQIAWFYYTLEDMPVEYWELVALHYQTRSDVRVNLSDSHELSRQVGIPVAQRNIPDLWILTVESLTLHK